MRGLRLLTVIFLSCGALTAQDLTFRGKVAVVHRSSHKSGSADVVVWLTPAHPIEPVVASMPISSLKSYMGHTLGACGALEAWMTIEMMRSGWFAPTINLERVDPECAALDYLTGDGRAIELEYVMSNNFAFGGINTSLIFRRQG